MKLEIVNPSDECYLESDDLEAMAFSTLFISDGKYALQDEEGNQVLPLFLFANMEEIDKHWQDKFGHTVIEFAEGDGCFERIANACESFYYVGERSSLNDIGDAFKRFGERNRKKANELKNNGGN